MHQPDVRIARTGVTVRYRQTYFAAKPPSEAVNRPTLQQLLRDPLDAAQIGLLGRATPDLRSPAFP